MPGASAPPAVAAGADEHDDDHAHTAGEGTQFVNRVEVTLESRSRIILVGGPAILGGKRLVASPRAEQHAAQKR